MQLHQKLCSFPTLYNLDIILISVLLNNNGMVRFYDEKWNLTYLFISSTWNSSTSFAPFTTNY